MTTYLALVRGINVGGNSLVNMTELKACLEKAGFGDVRTYIQSGNVFFSSSSTNTMALAMHITDCLQHQFNVIADTVIFTKPQWSTIVAEAPAWWGKDPAWKHNLLVLLPPYDMGQAVTAVGALKPDIEAMAPGDGVLYQSMSRALFGRTTTGKLAGSPIYKRMTVRNYNTAQKLLELF